MTSQTSPSILLQKVIRKVLSFFLAPIDPIRLDTFRLFVGLSMLIYFLVWWQNGNEWLTTNGFHVSAQSIGSVPVLPAISPQWLPFFQLFFWGSLICWTFGIKTAWATWFALIAVSYVTFVDILAAYTTNKLYIVILAVMALTPSDTYWSPEVKKKQPISAWPVRILQLTMVVHYFSAGYAKMVHGEWLRQPTTLWTQIQGLYMTDTAAWMLNLFPMEFFSCLQWLALSFEVFAPILFFFKPLRVFAITAGFIFQMTIALTMHQLIYFSLLMICFYVLFFQDKTLHRFRLQAKQLASNLIANE